MCTGLIRILAKFRLWRLILPVPTVWLSVRMNGGSTYPTQGDCTIRMQCNTFAFSMCLTVAVSQEAASFTTLTRGMPTVSGWIQTEICGLRQLMACIAFRRMGTCSARYLSRRWYPMFASGGVQSTYSSSPRQPRSIRWLSIGKEYSGRSRQVESKSGAPTDLQISQRQPVRQY